MNDRVQSSMGKLSSGISGVDAILRGGFPERSINVIAGPPGSGKTILTQQCIYRNTGPDRKALYFTTPSEPTMKMLQHLQHFTFFETDKVGRSVIYLDIGESILERGAEETVAAIVRHVEEHQPALVAIDDFRVIVDMTQDRLEARKLGYQLAIRLAAWGVTTFFVGVYTQEEMSQRPVFTIVDGIIRLSYQPYGLQYQRYIDVIKMRSVAHTTGLHPFTIGSTGLTVYPRFTTSGAFTAYTPGAERLSTGIPGLDTMVQGGVPTGTSTLVVGGSGTGKTLLGLQFVIAGTTRGDPGVLVTFQENPVQLRSIALSLGWDIAALEQQRLLTHLYLSAAEVQPDIAVHLIQSVVQQYGARRVLIDPISDIERATPGDLRYRHTIYALLNIFKAQGITTFLTREIPLRFGTFEMTDHSLSVIADTIILLRYMELSGRLGRIISVTKARGTHNSNEIRTFDITSQGIRIGETMRELHGVLTGAPVWQDTSVLHALPSSLRYIVETLSREGSGTLQTLQRATGLTQRYLKKELSVLQQRGIVTVTHVENRVYYRLVRD